ncbi:MAG TPA: bi-domain-containing oxidoreductase, partial [Gemmatimonadales bacterium]
MLQKARREGWKSTWDAVQTKLDSSLPVGYSSAGTVLAVGDGSSPFRVGDRVACGGGGYATHSEIAFVPYNLCARIPDGVAAEAAAFATIGAVGLHGLRLGRVEFGGSVAVIGLGIIGQIVVQAARAAGLRVVAIDRDASRVALATANGAEVGAVLGKDDPAQVVARLTSDTGVDAAIITAATESNDPLILGAQCCRDRGRVVAVGAIGLDVPRKMFFEKELELVVSRSYGPGRYDPVYEEHGVDYPLGYVRWTEQRNLETFVQLAATGGLQMAPLITHRFPIADAASAYNLITGEQKEPFLGVTLSYPAAPKADKAVMVRSAPAARAGMAKVGVAVIGAGNYARMVLLPRLAKMAHVRLVAVTSAGGVSALDAARQFGFERAATGHEDVIADPAVQCVIIETRHNLHAEIAEQALKAGKATFIEKPLALTEDQLKRVASAWVAGGRPAATVGFNRRAAPMIGALRQFQSGRRGPWIITLRVNAGFIPDTSWVVDPDVGGGRLLGEG